MSILRRKQRGPVQRRALGRGRPDARIFGRSYRGPSPAKIGLVLVILLAIGSYLAFTKQIPFTSHGYELHATFQNATTLKPKSPVRIAGVNVGKVTDVELAREHGRGHLHGRRRGPADPQGRHVTIRPRLFLEGNFFLDLDPAARAPRTCRAAGTIPVTPDRHRGPARPDPDLAAEGQPHGPQAGARGLRQRAHPQADRGRGRDPGPGPGPDRREALNQTFKYGGKAGRDLVDRQPGAPGRAPARPLEPDPRPARTCSAKLASDRGRAQGPDHQLQHHRRRARVGVDQPLGDDPRAGADARAGPAVAPPRRPRRCRRSGPWRSSSSPASASSRRRSAPAPRGSSRPKRLLQKNELGNAASYLAQAAPRARADDRRGAAAVPADGLLSQCVSHNLIPAGNRCINDAGGLSDSPPASRTTASSSTARSSSRARARASTATAPSSASRPAAVRTLTKMANPGGGPLNESLWAHNISPPLGTRPRLPGQEARRRSAWTSPATRTPSRTSTARCRASRPPDPQAVHEARDPRAPARLHRDRRPRRAGDRHDRRDPGPAAGQLPVLGPDPRPEPLRAQGRVQLGPGGDARAGPDGDHRRDQGRERPGREPRERARGRDHGHRPQVRAADPHRRLAAAAPAHRPAGHDDRDRPGPEATARSRRARPIPLAKTQPNVKPDQILASLDGDTRSFLQLLLQGGGPGALRSFGSSCRPGCAASTRPPATSPRSTARSRSGVRTCAA